jgi:RimJ/RimL family protein N-acetyltransferase
VSAASIAFPWLRLLRVYGQACTAPVALRRILPGDAAALQDFVRALSPAARQLRFHGALNELPETTLLALTRVDQREHVAFVLTVTENGSERIVGEARYVVSETPDTAEFGVAVADAFQGRRLAQRLLARLIDAARASGLRWLVGDVLAGNSRMLAFTSRCGFAVTTRRTPPGLVRVERCVDQPLPEAAPMTSWAAAARHAVRRLLGGSRPAQTLQPGFALLDA